VSAVAPAPLGHAPQSLPADATRLLYERYSGRIFGYCLSLLGSREEAEDAVQTTFLNAQSGLGRGVVPEFELAWLFKIAKNVCHNRRVSSWRRGRLESARDFDALQDVLATPERGDGVSIGELTRALGAIPERQRRALLLREWQGLSYAEIADELGVSVAAVETLIFRARRSVAEQLEQTGVRWDRGAVASLATLLRQLFGGAAVPLKLAAVAVGVTAATATTLAVTQAPHRHHSTPVPVRVAPPVTRMGAVPAHRSAVSHRALHRVTRTVQPSVRPAATKPMDVGTAVASSTPRDVTSPRTSTQDVAPPTTVVPTAVVPDATLPTVTTPSVELPQVSVPQVDLPVDAPALPDLPAVKLP
jgi:RNA polymerase sigma factor (sigma-70 family)